MRTCFYRGLKQVLIIIVLGALSGCVSNVIDTEPLIKLASDEGVIYRPLVGSGDDWYVQPGNKEELIFSTGRDSYGNPTGLSDDSRWRIREVHIKLAEKDTEDTVFWPGRGTPVYDNSCVWFPGWTAPIEPISGLPLPMYPLEGYPWDSCGSHVIDPMPSQTARITATAEADWIEVEITVPDQGSGWYSLDIPGYTPTSSNVLRIMVDRPGDIGVTWTDGDKARAWTVTVPVDWFWCRGEWDIPVGPAGVCN